MHQKTSMPADRVLPATSAATTATAQQNYWQGHQQHAPPQLNNYTGNYQGFQYGYPQQSDQVANTQYSTQNGAGGQWQRSSQAAPHAGGSAPQNQTNSS